MIISFQDLKKKERIDKPKKKRALKRAFKRVDFEPSEAPDLRLRLTDTESGALLVLPGLGQTHN